MSVGRIDRTRSTHDQIVEACERAAAAACLALMRAERDGDTEMAARAEAALRQIARLLLGHEETN